MSSQQDYIQQVRMQIGTNSVGGASQGAGSGLAGSSDSDIRETAHFKQIKMRNMNSQASSNDGFSGNPETPVAKFALSSSQNNGATGSDLDNSSTLQMLGDSFNGNLMIPSLNQSENFQSRNIQLGNNGQQNLTNLNQNQIQHIIGQQPVQNYAFVKMGKQVSYGSEASQTFDHGFVSINNSVQSQQFTSSINQAPTYQQIQQVRQGQQTFTPPQNPQIPPNPPTNPLHVLQATQNPPPQQQNINPMEVLEERLGQENHIVRMSSIQSQDSPFPQTEYVSVQPFPSQTIETISRALSPSQQVPRQSLQSPPGRYLPSTGIPQNLQQQRNNALQSRVSNDGSIVVKIQNNASGSQTIIQRDSRVRNPLELQQLQSGRSISYESNDSRSGRNNVVFSFSGKAIPAPGQSQSHIQTQGQPQTQVQLQPQPQIQPQIRSVQQVHPLPSPPTLPQRTENIQKQIQQVQQNLYVVTQKLFATSKDPETTAAHKKSIQILTTIKKQLQIVSLQSKTILEQKYSNNKQIQNLLAQCKELEKRNFDLEQTVALYNAAKTNPQDLQDKFISLQSEHHLLKTYVKNVQTTRDELLKQLDKLRSQQLQNSSSSLSAQGPEFQKLKQQFEQFVRNANNKQNQYQKVISHYQNTFKQMEMRGSGNGDDNNLRQQLSDKELEIAELKKEKIIYERMLQDKINNTESQLKSYSIDNNNVQNLLQEIERLNSIVKTVKQEKRAIEEEAQERQNSLKKKLLEKESENRLLSEQIEVITNEYQRKLSDKDRRIRQAEQEIQNLNAKLRSRTNVTTYDKTDFYQINNNNTELRNLKERLAEKEEEVISLQRQKQNADKRYTSLLQTFNQIEEENSTKTQELQSLRRQLSNAAPLEGEVRSLEQMLAKKNQQVLELKSQAFQLTQMKMDIETLRNQQKQLKSVIAEKVNQNQQLQETISNLQSKLRQQKQVPIPSHPEQDPAYLHQTLLQKQSELSKLKQRNQLLETNIQQLEYELERAKNKVNSVQKSFQLQRQDYKVTIQQNEKRISQLQTKLRNIQQNYRNTNTDIESQLKQKQQQLKKVHEENKVLSNKLKNHQSKVSEIQTHKQTLHGRVAELQEIREKLEKQVQTLEKNNPTKKIQELQLKIVELDSEGRIKESKIKQLQNMVESLKIKANHNKNPQSEEDLINQQQIEVLRKKIAEYESRLFNDNFTKNVSGYKVRDYESSYVFEQKVIYDLKSENERLKALLSGRSIDADIGSNSRDNGPVQRRLLEFNRKLEQMIEQNRTLEQQKSFSHLIGPQSNYNAELLRSFERERVSLLRKHRTEISALQSRMVDLQRYCSALESHTSISISKQTNTNINESKLVVSEQLSFYKQKNKELEDRIDNHIKLNQELKDKLENFKKSGDVSLVQYWKNLANDFEKDIATYLAKINQLVKDNQELLLRLQNANDKSDYENQISELENKIIELNRKIAQLQMQNGVLESDLSKYTQDLKNSSDELLRYKTNEHQLQQKISSLQSTLREWRTKVSDYESIRAELQNKIVILQQQNQRINQILRNIQRQTEQRLQHLDMQLRKALHQNEFWKYKQSEWQYQKNQYEQTISNLNGRISSLEQQINRLTTLFESLNRKVKDNDSQNSDLETQLQIARSRILELQSLLRNKDSQIYSLNEQIQKIRDLNFGSSSLKKQISDLEERIRQLEIQLNSRNSELQRKTKELFQSNKNYEESLGRVSVLEAELSRWRKIQVTLKYNLQFIRSALIEIQALSGEISVPETDQKQLLVVKTVRIQTAKGLDNVEIILSSF